MACGTRMPLEFCYRSGVTVLRSDGLMDQDTNSRGILVLQACDGMWSPADVPPDVNEKRVVPGKAIVINREGEKILPEVDWGPQNPLGDPITKGCLLLSHMPVHPLAEGELMPPREIADANARFIVENQWPTLDQRGTEHDIHEAFGGNRADHSAWRRGG
eukprot:gnl/TRDRNA2_/TRDRNA2_92648_c1_seq2.p1 gnl/TRDRNA2_/TRDRNA2_92648_c1~~gnl/TRDRNA2_/TRDRNA2_92648_c1_seq2.p1  ORF type:complete len:160 (+),score=29.02 gnl/TRDRNA2_/TRDRNA2_92648_c1_seq2:2-481(+)